MAILQHHAQYHFPQERLCQNAVHNITCETAQIQTLNHYSNPRTPQMNHSIFWSQQRLPNLHNETIHQKNEIQHQNLHQRKKMDFQHQKLRPKNYAKFATSKFTWKKLPKLQHPDLHGQKKTLTLQYPNLREPKNLPNLQHQTLREQKNAKFTTPKFTWTKKTPNLQHQNLREQKKRQIHNIKIYVNKKKRQIHNIKIYVSKKNAKFTTSKFT